MIIKSMSRKAPSFEQLMGYMLAAKGAEISLLHNMPASMSAPTAIVREFEENHELLPKRVNGNALYHEIIALEPDAAPSRREQIKALREIAMRYLARRAPHQLAIGVIHADTPHLHVHLMISSNALLSRRRVRLERGAYASILQEVEAYQIERFPQLGTTRLHDGERRGRKRSVREQAVSNRGEPTHNEQIGATLRPIFRHARSREALVSALAEQGLSLYIRGYAVGVRTTAGRKYRLTTLGLAHEYTEVVARFDLVESRLAELQRGRRRGERDLEREI